MKHLKLFEEINKYDPITPKVNDWVFAYDIDISNDVADYKLMSEFMRTHLGQVFANYPDDAEFTVHVKYFDIPVDVLDKFFKESSTENEVNIKEQTAIFGLLFQEITYWSNNKEELEKKMNIILATDKYNL